MQKIKLTGKTARELGSTYMIVKIILKNYPDTRDSDTILVAYVEKYCRENDIPFPSYSTILRCRRKVQNTDGLYKASKEVQKRRQRRQEEYREAFSRGN